MDLSNASLWWIAAGVAVAAELATGTFYLLMIALGLARGRPRRPVRRRRKPIQFVAAAVVGGGATALWHWRRVSTRRAGAADGAATATSTSTSASASMSRPGPTTARRGCSYRGSTWAARLQPGAPAVAGRARRRRRRGQLARPRSPPRHSLNRSTRMEPSFSTSVALVIAVVAAIFIFQTFKIVPQQHAWVVERLGKYDRTLAPGPRVRRALHRARRLQALAEGSAARRAEPGLHHARQHPAAGRRHHLFPGHRPDARELRLEQLHRRDHPAGADAAALGDRQDGARPDLRGARPHQPLGRRRARRGGARTGASRCCATRSRT